MIARTRTATVLVTAVLALAAGAYASGWLVLVLIHVRTPLDETTYWRYFAALDRPSLAPYAKIIETAGIVGFGVPLLAWLCLLYAILKPRKRSIHGDARFARRADLSRLGLLKNDPTGIIVGKLGTSFLRLQGTRHALLAAPTRSGKGVGAVIPNLLDYEDSMVVLDIKQEAFDITSKWRSKLGPAYLFNPFAEDLRTHRWNPFAYVRNDAIHRISDLQAIAACLYKDPLDQDPFWANMARSTFVATASLLFDCWADGVSKGFGKEDGYPTLGAIYRLLSGDGSDLKAHLKSILALSHIGHDTRTAFANITALAEQTFTSVIASTQAPLLIMANPILDKATSGNDFWLPDLRRRVQSIYVGIAPSKLTEAAGLLNLFFNQAIKLNVDTTPDKDPTLRHQCLFMLDEFTALGRVDVMVDGVAYFAGYNVRVFCVIQSLSQLDAVYGAEKARSMITNLACQIIYTPREQRDANEYSDMLGYTTERKRQRTRSKGRFGQGSSVSYAEMEEKRALMLPQELKALDPKKEIVFIEGTPHPIRCNKIRYYEDGYFKPRLQGTAAVPHLETVRERATAGIGWL
ncbi:type IV secretory system conjugative DNA transfer family protein [Frateuria terrea]|uniref:Type IV secretion system protein VirD4 n=1 Tax=Frateuria terrea TaxID=529704 RepID=A0A1H6TTE5_9GAMM|nr:type IV secretory system conjugative DNA transfer family protein [Frateuria terrea]SEI83338.1 type IV secretion system protein VirD4 [Frateuria terrea]SFP40353.1 type IV secretion system protein VirD4 [Frateuria terrea]